MGLDSRVQGAWTASPSRRPSSTPKLAKMIIHAEDLQGWLGNVTYDMAIQKGPSSHRLDSVKDIIRAIYGDSNNNFARGGYGEELWAAPAFRRFS